VNIFFFDQDIIISPSDVEFSEDPSIFYLSNEFWDEWSRIPVVDSVVIEFMIVYNWAQLSIFLLDKEE
jgi:hypothetical protein